MNLCVPCASVLKKIKFNTETQSSQSYTEKIRAFVAKKYQIANPTISRLKKVVSLQRNFKEATDMAIAIKSVPVLTGSVAKRFNQRAANALKKKHTVDWSEQVKIARDILANAKFNLRNVE